MEQKRFKQDLYQRAYSYALQVVVFTDKLTKDFTNNSLGNQLLRSGTSVSANLIEAKAASSKKDYINFYHHALKSANESKLWIGAVARFKARRPARGGAIAAGNDRASKYLSLKHLNHERQEVILNFALYFLDLRFNF